MLSVIDIYTIFPEMSILRPLISELGVLKRENLPFWRGYSILALPAHGAGIY
jgi:hypothetical protein